MALIIILLYITVSITMYLLGYFMGAKKQEKQKPSIYDKEKKQDIKKQKGFKPTVKKKETIFFEKRYDIN